MESTGLHPGLPTQPARESDSLFFGLNKNTGIVFFILLSVAAGAASAWLSHPLENWIKLLLVVAFIVAAYLVLRFMTDRHDPAFYQKEWVMLKTLGQAATLTNAPVRSASTELRTLASEIIHHRSKLP